MKLGLVILKHAIGNATTTTGKTRTTVSYLTYIKIGYSAQHKRIHLLTMRLTPQTSNSNTPNYTVPARYVLMSYLCPTGIQLRIKESNIRPGFCLTSDSELSNWKLARLLGTL